jgi:hypothetical protein
MTANMDHLSDMMLTWAATTRQPSENRTHVCICRPTFPGVLARSNRVEATARSRPYAVMTAVR